MFDVWLNAVWKQCRWDAAQLVAQIGTWSVICNVVISFQASTGLYLILMLFTDFQTHLNHLKLSQAPTGQSL